MNEEWRDVPGYGGHYQASTLGRVRAKDRVVMRYSHLVGRVIPHHYAGRLLSPCDSDAYGHQSVSLGIDGTRRSVFVHHLVLEAFVGPRPAGMVACHNDGDARNNRPDNLRWDTQAGNNADRQRHGRYPTGERHPMAKLSDAQRREAGTSTDTADAVMARYGISRTHLYRLRREYR